MTGAQTDLATYDGMEKLYNAIQSSARPLEAVAINAGVGVGGILREPPASKMSSM